MSDQRPPEFQGALEAIEGATGFDLIPVPVNPLQAQTAFERRAWLEDLVAHTIAIILTAGFFLLAFAALLGFVNISNAAVATFLGTTMGYAVGSFNPILQRYFHRASPKMQGASTTQPSTNGEKPP
jgi:hypothetical protein